MSARIISGKKMQVKGLITAAGFGKRFGAVTQNLNKACLKVEDKSLVRHAIEKFQSAGINEIYVVTGYLNHLLEKEVSGLAQTLFNPFYRQSGILGSFWQALPALQGSPFLFTTCDHFFLQEIVKGCLQRQTEICVVVQKKDRYTEEDAKVILGEGNRVFHFGKNIPVEEAGGEFAGMAYFGERGSSLFFEGLKATLEKGSLNNYMMDVLNSLRENFALQIESYLCEEGTRVEIDSVRDLREARRLFQTQNFHLKEAEL